MQRKGATVMVLFSEADRARVNEAVRATEARTSAEIVPVIAQSSGRYDRGEDLAGLWLGAVALSVVWWVFPAPAAEGGRWDMPGPGWQLAALLAALITGFLAGGLLAARIDWLRRLFTPAAELREEVDRRAREVFFDQRVHHTPCGSGLLLYISLLEHRAAVIADQTVLERLGQPALDEICRTFTTRLHAGNVIDALCETIAELGARLATELPRGDQPGNLLPDALIVLD